MSPRFLYRVVAVAEAITWTLLILGMVLKYAFRVTELGVQIGGFLHGLVFIAYLLTVVLVGVNQHWSARLVVLAGLTSVIPFATVPFERRLERRGMLVGAWRRSRTSDPRDHTRVSALLRWGLNRPVLLATVLALGLASIMTTLLTLGPPGGGS